MSDSAVGIVLLTTFDAPSRIIAHQDISIDMVQRQAKHLGLTLLGIPMHRASSESYVSRVTKGLELLRQQFGPKVKSLVFGDLHLEHIKTWREAELGKLGYSLEFPLWHSSYKDRVVVSCALMLPQRSLSGGVVHGNLVLAVAASRIEVSLADFVASLRKEGQWPALYADGAANLEKSFEFLRCKLPGFPALGERLLFKRTDLWLGGETLSTLHFDNVENLFAQLVGEKEFLLCPPGDTPLLADGRLRKAYATWQASEGSKGNFERKAEGLSDEAVMNYAVYDVDDPPEEYAELAAQLRKTVVTVRAGEVLYLPFGWWHQVRGRPSPSGLCCSAASFFQPFFAVAVPYKRRYDYHELGEHVTSLILKSLPPNLSISRLCAFLEKITPGKYDFIHLPHHEQTRHNIALAFINFVDHDSARNAPAA
eukprot:g24429.t1